MFAAINGIWSYKGIPVLYDLTLLLYLKLSEQRGEGKKKGKKQDGKEAKNRNNNGENKRGKKRNGLERVCDKIMKQGLSKGDSGKCKTIPPPPKCKSADQTQGQK